MASRIADTFPVRRGQRGHVSCSRIRIAPIYLARMPSEHERCPRRGPAGEPRALGIPATGKKVVMESTDWARVNSDGVFIEHWAHADNLSMVQQLGVIAE